jgi:hypothetical protein
MMREPAFSLLPIPKRTSLSGKRVLVLGLGDSGLSAARWTASCSRASPEHCVRRKPISAELAQCDGRV